MDCPKWRSHLAQLSAHELNALVFFMVFAVPVGFELRLPFFPAVVKEVNLYIVSLPLSVMPPH